MRYIPNLHCRQRRV